MAFHEPMAKNTNLKKRWTMNKEVVRIWSVFAVCITIIFLAGVVKAENEAVFNPATRELNIPKVIVGSNAYDITMKLEAHGFVLTDFGLNNDSDYVSGTYDYNPSTGLVGINFTKSTFKDDGPALGYMEVTVMSITEKQLTFKNPSDEIEIWTRISGTGSDLNGQWLKDRYGFKNILEFSAGGNIKYTRRYTYFSLQKKSISIDGDFSDWEGRDRIYRDSNGPECGNTPGRDLKEVYVAYDDYFTYVRFVVNGPLDGTFGYKFGNEIHINVSNNRLQYASGTLLHHGITLPDSFLAIRGNQFEYKVPTLENWHNQAIAAWLDQGYETICRDHVALPLLVGGKGAYE